MEIEAPVLIPQTNWRELQVTASTTDGQAIASVRRDLKELTSLSNGPFLVAVYCTDDAICRSVQSQIALGENGRSSSQMSQNLRLTTVRDARAGWWAYRAVQSIVLAGPISGFSSGELQALENFTRGGSGLVVLEGENAAKDFLAAYRQGAPTPAAIQVGGGHLFRVRSVASEDLGRIFASGMAGRIGRETPSLPLQASADSFLMHIGVAFAFPRLRWLPIIFGIAMSRVHSQVGWHSIPLTVRAPLYLNPLFFLTAALAPRKPLYPEWFICLGAFVAVAALCAVLTLRNLRRSGDFA